MKRYYSIRIETLDNEFIAFLSVKGKTEWISLKRVLNHAHEYFVKTENVIVKVI